MESYNKIRMKDNGLSAGNPLSNYDSSSRGGMFVSHSRQTPSLKNPEREIVTNGMEINLSKGSFSYILPESIEVKGFTYKTSNQYNQITDEIYEITIHYIKIGQLKDEVEYVTINKYQTGHEYLGFTYRFNLDVLSAICPGCVIKKDTVLAYSPGLKEDGTYRYGVLLNTVMLTSKYTIQDSIAIRKGVLPKFQTDMISKHKIVLNKSDVCLNLYGDDKTYKVLPDIGEKVNKDGIYLAIRSLNKDIIDPSDMSTTSLRSKNYSTDTFHTVTKPAYEYEVVDIEVVLSVPAEVLPKEYEQLIHIAKRCEDYKNQNLIVYEKLKNLGVTNFSPEYIKETTSNYLLGRKDKQISLDRYNKTFVSANYYLDKKPIEIAYIDITIKAVFTPGKGSKFSNKHGNKGVASKILEEYETITDEDGLKADIEVDPNTISNRMNEGYNMERYIGAASRNVRTMLRKKYKALSGKEYTEDATLDKQSIDTLYRMLTDFYKLFDNSQYIFYTTPTARLREMFKARELGDIEYKKIPIRSIKGVDSHTAKLQIILESMRSEVYVYLDIRTGKSLKETIRKISKDRTYAPKKKRAYRMDKDGNKIWLKNKVLIAPLYTILNYKTGDNLIGTGLGMRNGYGLPTADNRLDRYIGSGRPVKVISETEMRLYSTMLPPGTTSTLLMLTLNRNVTRKFYKNLLEGKSFKDYRGSVAKSVKGESGTVVSHIYETVFKCSGVQITE